ncbi:hypothetical protein GGR51DRAFT_533110 [Nemania sp. FL0031]|nr:hypothetical protein GGR51DRAFT_533110 [Nemania sp. FL0031]
MNCYSKGGLDKGSFVFARNWYEYPSKLGMSLRDVAKWKTETPSDSSVTRYWRNFGCSTIFF